MPKPKKKRRPKAKLTAQNADRHVLYGQSVQNVEAEIDFAPDEEVPDLMLFRIMPGLDPELTVNGRKQILCLRMPRPPQIVGQIT